MTKEDLLAFIGYLKRKDNVIIVSHLHEWRTLTGNRRSYDSADTAREYLRLIKAASSLDAAYADLAHIQGKHNPTWRAYPAYCDFYLEDLEEYLVSLNVAKSTDLANTIARGGTKWDPQFRNRKELPDDLKKWAAGVKGLLSRESIPRHFPEEFAKFKEGMAHAERNL